MSCQTYDFEKLIKLSLQKISRKNLGPHNFFLVKIPFWHGFKNRTGERTGKGSGSRTSGRTGGRTGDVIDDVINK